MLRRRRRRRRRHGVLDVECVDAATDRPDGLALGYTLGGETALIVPVDDLLDALLVIVSWT